MDNEPMPDWIRLTTTPEGVLVSGVSPQDGLERGVIVPDANNAVMMALASYALQKHIFIRQREEYIRLKGTHG